MKLIDPIDIKKQVKEGHLTFFVEKGRIYCKEPTCTVEVGRTDAVEVKQGEWILIAENSTGNLYRCSVCTYVHNPNKQDVFMGRMVEKPKFCPNCGADMRGGKE